MTPDLTIVRVEQTTPLLGRQLVHDPRSRNYPHLVAVDRSTWHDKAIRLYDPHPNPNQPVGNCTLCAKAMQLNAVGNRRLGRVLNMDWALRGYSIATRLDPFPGAYLPDDTGSSGLASAKTAQQTGDGGEFRWLFGGADEIVSTVCSPRPLVVSVGTWWYGDMFSGSGQWVGLPMLRPTGGRVGGHQYAIRGYDKDKDLALGRCWWGGFRDFWISRTDLDSLVRDGGDAHVQATT